MFVLNSVIEKNPEEPKELIIKGGYVFKFGGKHTLRLLLESRNHKNILSCEVKQEADTEKPYE